MLPSSRRCRPVMCYSYALACIHVRVALKIQQSIQRAPSNPSIDCIPGSAAVVRNPTSYIASGPKRQVSSEFAVSSGIQHCWIGMRRMDGTTTATSLACRYPPIDALSCKRQTVNIFLNARRTGCGEATRRRWLCQRCQSKRCVSTLRHHGAHGPSRTAPFLHCPTVLETHECTRLACDCRPGMTDSRRHRQVNFPCPDRCTT